jgi:hypothetical protein
MPIVPLPYLLVLGLHEADGVSYYRTVLVRFNAWRGIVLN